MGSCVLDGFLDPGSVPVSLLGSMEPEWKLSPYSWFPGAYCIHGWDLGIDSLGPPDGGSRTFLYRLLYFRDSRLYKRFKLLTDCFFGWEPYWEFKQDPVLKLIS